jgi:hypothetical protein
MDLVPLVSKNGISGTKIGHTTIIFLAPEPRTDTSGITFGTSGATAEVWYQKKPAQIKRNFPALNLYNVLVFGGE